ncbi:hypothetical protein HWI79_2531 [Cryptosporidium felis]|nr:hypothetical protein HWI79_2531 [Cryptosporidium felis]
MIEKGPDEIGTPPELTNQVAPLQEAEAEVKTEVEAEVKTEVKVEAETEVKAEVGDVEDVTVQEEITNPASEAQNNMENAALKVQETQVHPKYYLRLRNEHGDIRENINLSFLCEMVTSELYRSNGIDRESPIDFCQDLQEDIDNILPFLQKSVIKNKL